MPVLDAREPHVVLQAATTQINPAAVDQTLPEHMLEPQHDEPSSSEVAEDEDDDDEQLSLLQFGQLQDQTTLSITSAYLIELPLAVCSLHNLLELSLNVSARPHCLRHCLLCFLVSCWSCT